MGVRGEIAVFLKAVGRFRLFAGERTGSEI